MKDLFKVNYVISDRGIDYPEKEEEVPVPKGSSPKIEIKRNLSKYRRAMELTPKFDVKIISQSHCGWSM
jgi:hypothetical protein